MEWTVTFPSYKSLIGILILRCLPDVSMTLDLLNGISGISCGNVGSDVDTTAASTFNNEICEKSEL